MSRVPNFTDQETLNLTDDFCHKLNLLRNVYFPMPINVTVGWRSKDDNNHCSGKPGSPHLMGKDRVFPPTAPFFISDQSDPEVWNGAEAMDVKSYSDPFIAQWFMWALGKAGFVNVEVCPGHIHFTNSKYVPQNAIYQGIDH